MSRTRRSAAVLLGTLALVSAATVAVKLRPVGATTPTQTIAISATQKHLTVVSRGNGHGHGLSQYGALGAANAGLKYPAILFFYYPKTKLGTVPPSATIRVRLSLSGGATTIAALSKTVVTGVTGALPITGVARYRLVANSGTGLKLQKLGSSPGATWQDTAYPTLPNNAEFRRTDGSSQLLYLTDGTSTRYYGALRAVRVNASGTAGGVRTINRVSYDRYVQGVVPNEMPTSWPAAATEAQAVAARTYGDYAAHHPASSYYDICDNSGCQVYGGHVHYNSNGTVAFRDYPPAAQNTAGQVLSYNDGPVFAQFSASNGGWTVDGGQPYLVAKQDPYDIAKYDPWINKTKSVTVASLASAFGLPKLTKLVITRDGHGTWGGRVLGVAGYNGTTHVDKDGFFLQNALGLGTTWIQLTPTA